MIKVEIACNNFTSCLNALNGGADRIELFENISDGGCTPSVGIINKAKELSIPCYVMIRPRGGNFCYSNDEIDIMLGDIEACKQAKVAGIVFGCLTKSGEIDSLLNKKILSAWNHGPATFHRAIDRTNDIIRASHTITDLGFERILSSGGALNIMEGLEVLKNMQNEFGRQIIIMPGAGVTPQNAQQIIEYTGCHEIHATCKQTFSMPAYGGNAMFTDNYQASDLNQISMLVNNLRDVGVR